MGWVHYAQAALTQAGPAQSRSWKQRVSDGGSSIGVSGDRLNAASSWLRWWPMHSSRHLLQEGSMTRKERQWGVTIAAEPTQPGFNFDANVAAWS